MNTAAPAATAPSTTSDAVAEVAVAPRTRLRITRRGRVVLTALVAAPLALGVGLVALNGGAAVASKDTSSTALEYVTVSSGQSLWDLAEEIAPSSDPRDVIASLVDLNRLPTSDVAAGQQLAVPAQYAH
ncbi:Cell division suppressor protein YneA [Clavibacter michiganensis]|uniref:Cell division suppressor protein YneA n=1 Tax=Clavibacter michiganensis TaxID=28447 RepID=A0A251YUT4_9MICO|nr:LysM peptidoglycan-binding domain-containing protein [Clavibacter michiganensis]OUE28000.1 Cell division suppressor protein YneA [Clavibacter michiganensis]